MKTMSLISKDSVPKAAALTLNFTADQVTKQQIKNVNSDFTVRTKFTINSMSSRHARPYKALNKAKGKKLRTMFSRSGTFSKYLWLQENNNEIRGIDGPIPIATKAARTAKSERRAIAKRFRLSRNQRFTEGSTISGGSGAETRVLRPKGRNRKFGIYQVKGRKMTMIRNLEHRKAKIKGTGFHKKAVKIKASNRLIAERFKRYGKQEIKKAVRRYA